MADGTDPEQHEGARKLFGYQDRNRGAASLVELSFAHVHDQHDRPVPLLGASLGDPVLAFLAAGAIRDHVRIDARGVAAERGKFDDLLVPAGARFTFEMLVHQADGAAPVKDLVARLAAQRLGGRTRRGYGRFRVLRLRALQFDLSKAEDRRLFASLPRAISEPDGGVLRPIDVSPRLGPHIIRGMLALEPEDHWMFGRGVPHRREHRRDETAWLDLVPVTERRVCWSATNAGSVETVPAHLVPGSGIKGALRHRVAFHARRRAGVFAGPQLEHTAAEDVPEVVALFGKVKERAEPGRGSTDRAGRVFLDDAYLEPNQVKYGRLEHVSLDRFTQGPIDGGLFGEAPLYQGRITLALTLDTRGVGASEREALADALADLCEGRLAVGAAGGRGHGFVQGHIDWSDGGRWIGGGA